MKMWPRKSWVDPRLTLRFLVGWFSSILPLNLIVWSSDGQKPTHRQRLLAPNSTLSLPLPLIITLPREPGNLCRTDNSHCPWIGFCQSFLQLERDWLGFRGGLRGIRQRHRGPPSNEGVVLLPSAQQQDPSSYQEIWRPLVRNYRGKTFLLLSFDQFVCSV